MDVTFNRANEGYYGILVDGTANYIYANRTRLNILGLVTFEGFDNVFDENDSRYNDGLDCLDDTGPDYRHRSRTPGSTTSAITTRQTGSVTQSTDHSLGRRQ